MTNTVLLDHCPKSLPANCYLDESWFQREQEMIWRREWSYVGRREGFGAGLLHRKEVAGTSIVVCCSQEGSLNAFHNVCMHRGSELCTGKTEKMRGRLITCPYHAWAYGDDGRLVSTAFATPTEDFDKRDHGLKPVHLQEWNGFVFVCLAETPPEFAPDLGIDALDNWPMSELVVGYSLEKTVACNWKVFWENYNECLHCPGVHPGLTQMVPVYSKGIMSKQEAINWDGDNSGSNLRMGAQSWTMSGAPCGPEFADLTQEERDEAHRFVTLYPTRFVVAHVDYVRVVSLQPIAPETTVLKAEWLFDPNTLSQPDFNLAHVTDFATGVLNEDASACEWNQRGLRSPAFQKGRLMPQEFYIHDFHNWVLERVARDGGEIPTLD